MPAYKYVLQFNISFSASGQDKVYKYCDFQTYNSFGVSLTTGLKLCRKSLATYKTPNHAGPNHKSLSKTKDQRPTLISISNNADAVANVQHNGLLQHDHTQAFSRQEMPQQTPRAVCLIMQQYGSIDDSLLYPFKAN